MRAHVPSEQASPDAMAGFGGMVQAKWQAVNLNSRTTSGNSQADSLPVYCLVYGFTINGIRTSWGRIALEPPPPLAGED